MCGKAEGGSLTKSAGDVSWRLHSNKLTFSHNISQKKHQKLLSGAFFICFFQKCLTLSNIFKLRAYKLPKT
jgi:hypothetical protein